MPIVVDPSAIIAIALTDEASGYAERVLDAIDSDGGQAPSIFWYELRNVLIVSERRGRITPEASGAFLATLAELPIEILPLPHESNVLDIARRWNLSVYDAACVELAVRSGARLATLDKRLGKAARNAGAEVLV